MLHLLHKWRTGYIWLVEVLRLTTWKLPILCTSYHNIRIYNIRTYCLCHDTLFVQPVYRLAIAVCELSCLRVFGSTCSHYIRSDCIMRALHVRVFMVCMLCRGDSHTLVPLIYKTSCSIWLCEGAYKYVYYRHYIRMAACMHWWRTLRVLTFRGFHWIINLQHVLKLINK